MFRRAITVCAAFFALAGVVHAADPTTPTFIPPRAGTDIPVILSLAKHSACKDAAKMIAADKSQIVNLKSQISNGLFPWRIEVTNGYQEGFFYHALQGYALEQSGDIPAAYRAYQNSRLYINKDAAWSTPDLEIEVYLGIGRTCMKAGRWTDALNYTETARINGAANSNIAVNADRLLIERARSIGDYKEAIELYKDLQSLAPLTRDEYKNYTQILFWSHRDREGFSKLLEGIAKLGIDNDLGVKDPMVDGFLNSIMRADDDEVKYFYDLLGWAIVDARALKGDEEFLAFLCNARTLFCKVYDFLEPEDDLKQVKKRIDQVKKKLASAKADGGVHVARTKKAKRHISTSVASGLSKEGTVITTPEVEVEDILMLGDYYLAGKRYNDALAAYSNALAVVTNTSLACLPYDGTTTKNAAGMGSALMNVYLGSLTQGYSVAWDESQRANILAVTLYALATNEVMAARYAPHFYSPYAILKSHPVYRRYCAVVASRLCTEERLAELVALCQEFARSSPATLQRIGQQWYGALLARGALREGFSAALTVSLHRQGWLDAEAYVGWCSDQSQIDEVNSAMQRTYLKCALRDRGRIRDLIELLASHHVTGSQYKECLDYVAAGRHDEALAIYNQMLQENNEISLAWIAAVIYEATEQYDKACETVHNALRQRQKIVRLYLHDAPIRAELSDQEMDILRACTPYLTQEQTEWLKEYNLSE